MSTHGVTKIPNLKKNKRWIIQIFSDFQLLNNIENKLCYLLLKCVSVS